MVKSEKNIMLATARFLCAVGIYYHYVAIMPMFEALKYALQTQRLTCLLW